MKVSHPLVALAAVFAAWAASAIQPATADTLFEVEHARASARAGGPVSAHEQEFLDRWGPTSDTPKRRYRSKDTFEWYSNAEDPRVKPSRRERN